MSEHFIKNIEIKNFKCFTDFKAEGFGRVNLIGGKNNVGKTAFMEAVYVNVRSQTINASYHSMTDIAYRRDNLELIEMTRHFTIKHQQEYFEKTKQYYSKSNINEIKYKLIYDEGIKEYAFTINGNYKTINSNDFSYQKINIKNIHYIDNFGLNNKELKDVYIAVQRKDKEEDLYSYINYFDKNIEKFKVMGGESPECKLKGKNEYRYINEFGDGLKHYISIICSLYACEDGYLFIDEIDNGIHYTQLDKLWEIILEIADEQNVQVFATTHSKEAIESYARVAKRLKDEEITYTILTKLEDNSIDAGVYSASMLINTIDQEHEVRGW